MKMKESKITPGERSYAFLISSAGLMALLLVIYLTNSEGISSRGQWVFLGIQSILGVSTLIRCLAWGHGWKLCHTSQDFEIHDRRGIRESGALADLRLFREDARGYILAARKGEVYRLLRKDADPDLQVILQSLEKVR
jgi:hypothetical protein